MKNNIISNGVKRNIILAIVIILLVILSQWAAVKLVYAHKITGNTAVMISSLYNLKMGSIEKDGEELNIYLKDYFNNKDFVSRFIAKQYEQAKTEGQENLFEESKLNDEQVDEVVWQKIVKDAWLNNVAETNEITITEDELNEYINLVGGVDYIKEITEKDYGLQLDDYVDLIIRPRVLEEKVYSFLLDNYQDVRAVERVQEVYTLLEAEDGSNWQEVGEAFSDDMTYVNNSLWLQEEDLVDFYEVIKYLEVGQHSKIVKVPTGYIIWKLESLSNDENTKAYEVRSIFIAAKTLNDFLDDYLSETQIKKIY